MFQTFLLLQEALLLGQDRTAASSLGYQTDNGQKLKETHGRYLCILSSDRTFKEIFGKYKVHYENLKNKGLKIENELFMILSL